ncbi:MAG: 2-oxoacid:acceptor oxidoreductase family protein [bacterium]
MSEAAEQKVLQWPESIYHTFDRKPGSEKKSTHYCPGCGHGVLHKLIAEAMDDFGVRENTVFVSPVGCSVFGYYYFNCGNVQAAHGRAPAVATGIKRSRPESVVISYQGDGDLAAIGTNNILHAANRGEPITVFFVNNAIYGMTGGQMAPTTLEGQDTTTSPGGRDIQDTGAPLHMSELLSTLDAPVYIERVALTDARNILGARKAVRKALKAQIDGKGFSMVEILSPCPVGWKMDPVDAKQWITDNMLENFPLGTYRDRVDETEPRSLKVHGLNPEKVQEIFARDPQYERQGVPSWEGVPERYREPEVKVAGFGGQGVLFLGALLANVALRKDFHVTWLPAYGPESRGGTANCNVVVSTDPVASPLVTEPTVAMAFNGPSLDKFAPRVVPGGLIIYNSSLISEGPDRTDVEVLPVPATGLADELGDTKVANLVLLGAYLGYTGLFTEEDVNEALDAVIKHKEMLEMDRHAVARGYEYAAEQLREGQPG